MDEILEDTNRVTLALRENDNGAQHGHELLLSDAELTATLLLLHSRASELWQILSEPLLEELKQNHSLFAQIWDAKAPPPSTKQKESAADTLQQANIQLTGSFIVEPADHAQIPWPGFATPLGPSVYRCKCGFIFGDPHNDLEDPIVMWNLKEMRNHHFRAMFGADYNGYPTETSVHFPLHRAVQRILTTSPFDHMLERTEAMEWSVADYLRRKKRGNIHIATIRKDIQFAIDTYLDCRVKGMPEPSKGCPAVDFLTKAKLEQKLILQARVSGEGQWIDRQR